VRRRRLRLRRRDHLRGHDGGTHAARVREEEGTYVQECRQR
jgi:hypothetical protein